MAESGSLWRRTDPLMFYKKFQGDGVRVDGRKNDEFAKLEMETGIIRTAQGSVNLRLGNTTLMCGIKVKVGAPTLEKPSEGYLIPNVELMPLCSRKFKMGPPSEEAQRLNFFLYDILHKTNCLDLTTLCIAEGRFAYVIHVDLVVLNYDGSVADACLLATAAALLDAKVPRVEYVPEKDGVFVKPDETFSLQLTGLPLCSSFALFDGSAIFVQPTQEEEEVSRGTVTVSVADGKLVSVHKFGGHPMSAATLRNLCDRAIDQAAVHWETLPAR